MTPLALLSFFFCPAVAVSKDTGATCAAGRCSQGLSMIQLAKGSTVDINQDWLIVNNKHYSRKKAHDAWLGRVGLTSGIWIRPVLINFKLPAPDEWLEDNVNVSTTVSLDAEQVRKIAAAVDASVVTPGGIVSGGAGVTHNSTHSASYVLRGLTIENTLKIKHWFNEERHNESNHFVHDYMDMFDYSKKPRIVTTVWVLVRSDDETASSCTGGHLTLRWNGGLASGSISGDGCSRSSWSFDPNSIIAYEASYLRFANMHTLPSPSGRVKDVVSDWFWTR
eukprot:TRINITY_DN111153_c0_g1_i1.p1 TRINITY_DN111153_c0_g1~~TRINITY_DN111153_c0_g1_i1.p1  ORF type:complete len:279 (-),score=40.18 TRINITY_DN111153_c0_g1_i1:137-973(-)